MSERDSQERGFTVVDRRGSTPEGEASAPAESSPPPASAAPRLDFAMLVQSFAITALHYLGRVAHPATGEAGERNIPAARQNIEILELLEVKTRGNLEPEEAQLLSSLLYEVRMHYVEATKQPG